MSTLQNIGRDRIPTGATPTNWPVAALTSLKPESILLTNKAGYSVRCVNVGASIVEINVPDKRGHIDNIVLGYQDINEYCQNPSNFGCTIGRCANRIKGGSFEIEGELYQLTLNDRGNTLHGGQRGFGRALWERLPTDSEQSVRYRLVSPDNDEGFPGQLIVDAVMTWNDENQLIIEYSATTNKATIVNLTNHSYFNLAGAGHPEGILDHVLSVDADHYTPTDDQMIPTGRIESVIDTPLNLTFRRPLREVIAATGGLDHHFMIRGEVGAVRRAARLDYELNGRVLIVETSTPGIQVYTGNHFGESLRPSQGEFGKYGGICLETQHPPDAIHNPKFPSPILLPGEYYQAITVFSFKAL